jgi:hypothetical protein
VWRDREVDASVVIAPSLRADASATRGVVRRADLLLAAVATMVAVGGIELGLRGLLDAGARAALPAVGASADEVSRRAWLGRRHDQADGLGWDRSDALLGWRPLPGLHRRNYRAGVFDAMVSTNAAGLRGAADVARASPPRGGEGAF